MKIYLAGATGALGTRLLPLLTGAGHDVVATTRSAGKAAQLTAAGATPAVVDALDADAVMDSVAEARPDVVIHQLTSLSGTLNLKKFDEYFAATNALRSRGTENLLMAARAAGTKRVLVQSYAGWPNDRTGSAVKTEDDPLDPTPASAARQTHAAISALESMVTGAHDLEGLVLRYGAFYGPGTGWSADGDTAAMVRKRKFPIVGGGTGIWSFVHIDDAAAATAAAVERGAPGIYNIVDDDPAPVSAWLPYLAEALGGKPPRRLPVWLAKPMIGDQGIAMMTSTRGSSNAKARRELAWTPTYPSWRKGFRALNG
ncbi:NAD(P)-dependent oxidoreductase [Phytoactinopolyspora alkaliphila]|uniref:NAD(P)-dependent oxidoreductase n=1 Tax=Phytoactinopolyspora alkaliphila TaxID=1783498 RepID=A0A6N9YIH6_9ACTN|nr:NAD(P)-dependent oxidoreductase [Phytoactinopolyspora alkaliphila]NED94851.1 NAD(P)-dependent oxidoreductase [Phytoactinopolyspora alkaliphila]